MKCLSLWNPWAVLWASGQKKIETRSWPYQGELPCVLAVHASKKWTGELSDVAEMEPFRSSLKSLGVNFSIPVPGRKAAWGMPLGAVVGMVRLVECVNTLTLIAPKLSPKLSPCLGVKYLDQFPNEQAFGDFTPGRYGWCADRFCLLENPIPCVGRQSIWELPVEVAAQIPANILKTVASWEFQ